MSNKDSDLYRFIEIAPDVLQSGADPYLNLTYEDRDRISKASTLVTHSIAYWEHFERQRKMVNLLKDDTCVATFTWCPVILKDAINPALLAFLDHPKMETIRSVLDRAVLFSMDVSEPSRRMRGKGKKYLKLFLTQYFSTISSTYTHAVFNVEKKNAIAFQFACSARARIALDTEHYVFFLLDLKNIRVF